MVGFKATDVPPTATVKFLGAGTAACIADLITFPLDTAKVRLQVRLKGGSWCSLSGSASSAVIDEQPRAGRRWQNRLPVPTATPSWPFRSKEKVKG